MSEKLKRLDESEKEANRFLQKVKAAKERINKDNLTSNYDRCLEYGAVKRAALDLKMVLTTLNKPLC